MMKDQKPLILVIDDEESLRDGCRQALEKYGYAVLTAGEGVDNPDCLPKAFSPDPF